MRRLTLQKKVIVCGLGHVGYRIALLLRRLDCEVSAIHEQTPADWLAHAAAQGIACHAGDARDDALLDAAGIRSADVIIAATDRDMTNIAIAMDARRLNPSVAIVARLFDTRLAPRLETALGLRKAFSTSSLAAPVFASVALGDNLAGCFAAAGRAYTLVEVAISSDSPWIGQDWATIAKHDAIVPLFGLEDGAGTTPLTAAVNARAGQRVMLLRKAVVTPPESAPAAASRAPRPARRGVMRRIVDFWLGVSPGIKAALAALAVIVGLGTLTFRHFLHMDAVDAFYFVITTISTTGYGDYNLQGSPAWIKLFGCLVMLCGAALMAVVFSVVTDRLLKTRFRRLLDAPAEAADRHAIVVGHNNVGQRIAGELLRAGMPVVVVTPAGAEPGDFDQTCPYPVIRADPRSDAALERAGVRTADAVIAVTEDDVTNLGVALQARTANPAARTVIRTFDADLGAKLRGHLGVTAVISASAVSAPAFAASALCEHVIHAMVWHERLILVQFRETGTLPPPAANAATVAFRLATWGDASDLGIAQVDPGADAPQLRISAVRLA